MQMVDEGQPFRVVVDFAHTPAALEAVLRSLRRVGCDRLIVVFGSAGDQDRGKRPLLGRTAATLADYAVVTDEDPRSEDPQKIVDAIADGARKAKPGFRLDIILDRRQAIRCAIEAARPGDIVLLAGKGHETSIAYQDRDLAWDEAREARAALVTAGYGGS
jgi:UDP-N-acetylmuramoyl-L-alanyl-D-glutamate--2,6-diaminopimelate ligase